MNTPLVIRRPSRRLLHLAFVIAASFAPGLPAAETAPAGPRVRALDAPLRLGESAVVDIDGLSAWAAVSGHDVHQLVPFIHGRPLPGVTPEAVHLEQDRLTFHLEITSESREAWDDLLREPVLMRKVPFTVGPPAGPPFASEFSPTHPASLVIIPKGVGVATLLILAVTWALCLRLAFKTDLLRNPGPPATAGTRRPFNLGRLQLAFWFLLIVSSYLAIWLITGNLDTITPALLGLMGISAGTALADAMVDANKAEVRSENARVLGAEKAALETRLAEIAAPAGASTSLADPAATERAAARARIAAIDATLRELDGRKSAAPSRGLITDILSDASGYSIHRFQIAVWTLVLGVIFVVSVYNTLAMPEFSTTLLGLMGLSSGTYVGLKFPEK